MKDNIFIILGLFSMGLAFTATDIYVPALPAIQHYFSVSVNQVQYTLSAYLLGLAVAQIISGPIVDHFGYRKILLPSIAIFIMLTLVCAFSPNIKILISARIFQALLAGVIGITARASFIKRFDSERTAYIFMTLAPAIILSAVIAPIIGGFIVSYINWQSIFLFLALYCIILFLGSYYYFYVNEEKPHTTKLSIGSIIQIYSTILKHKQFVQCIFINGIYLSVIFSYLTEAPFIYHSYQYSFSSIGLTFVPIAIAFLTASQLTRFLHKIFSLSQFVMLAFAFIAIGLLVMAIPAFYPTGLMPMTIGITIAVFGMGFSNPVAFGKGMTLFPQYAGAASSLLTALPFIAGTLFTLLVHPLCGNSIVLLSLFLFIITIICIGGYYILETENSLEFT